MRRNDEVEAQRSRWTFYETIKGFSMNRWERWTAAFLIFLGIGAAALAFRMGFGDLRHPGPGFFPFLAFGDPGFSFFHISRPKSGFPWLCGVFMAKRGLGQALPGGYRDVWLYGSDGGVGFFFFHLPSLSILVDLYRTGKMENDRLGFPCWGLSVFTSFSVFF